MPFQENVKTGDARVAGTTASLAGIEAHDDGGEDRVVLAHAIAMSTGGIPLLYLGDEVAQLNDYSYLENPTEAGTVAGRTGRGVHKRHTTTDVTPPRLRVASSSASVSSSASAA